MAEVKEGAAGPLASEDCPREEQAGNGRDGKVVGIVVILVGPVRIHLI